MTGNRRHWIWYLTAYLAVLLLRLPWVLQPPGEVLYNIDELELTLTAVDRFLGLAPTAMHWPGTILQFLFLPLFSVDYLIHMGPAAGLSANLARFALYLGEVYRHPSHAVELMRLVTLAISSLLPLLVFRLVSWLGAGPVTGVICGLASISSPLMFQHSVMASGDTTSITLALASLAVIVLRPDVRWREWAAGLLMGTAMTAKLTISGLLWAPVIYLLLEQAADGFPARIARVMRLLAGVALSLLIWFPFMWTDPIRVAKSVFGNVNKIGSHSDVAMFFHNWNQAATISIVALAILAWMIFPVAVRKTSARPFLIALGASFLIVAGPLYWRASSAETRYYLPLLPLSVLLLMASITAIRRTRPRLLLLLCAPVMLAASTAFGLTSAIRAEHSLRADYPLPAALPEAAQIANAPDILVPEEARIAGFEIPAATYERIYQRLAECGSADAELQAYLIRRGIPAIAARTLLNAFNEDDAAILARVGAMRASWRDRASQDHVVLWCDYDGSADVSLNRVGLCELGRTQARQYYLAHPGAVILVRDPDPALGQPLFAQRVRWVWYKNGDPSKIMAKN